METPVDVRFHQAGGHEGKSRVVLLNILEIRPCRGNLPFHPLGIQSQGITQDGFVKGRQGIILGVRVQLVQQDFILPPRLHESALVHQFVHQHRAPFGGIAVIDGHQGIGVHGLVPDREVAFLQQGILLDVVGQPVQGVEIRLRNLVRQPGNVHFLSQDIVGLHVKA